MKKRGLYVLLQFVVMLGFGQAYHVGDIYTAEDGSQGVVFYVKADGGGWAVSIHETYLYETYHLGLPWSTSTGDIPALPNISDDFPQQAMADTAGYSNTLAIRNALGTNPNYAGGVVDFEHGWYLPAAAQLSLIFAQCQFLSSILVSIGGDALLMGGNLDWDYTKVYYWTSTEQDAGHAWVIPLFNDYGTGGGDSLSFVPGTPTAIAKTNFARIRTVCSFPPPENVYDTTLQYAWNTGSTATHFSDVPLQTTTYTVTVTTPYGCTNSASVNVMVIDNNPQVIYDTVCQGSTYNNNGFTLSSQETAEVGEIVRTQTVSFGDCESDVTLFLTVLPHDTVHIEQTANQSYVWNGITYEESGTYTQYFNNQYGCDSTVVLTLTLDGGADPDPDPGPDPGPDPDPDPDPDPNPDPDPGADPDPGSTPDSTAFGESDTLIIYLPNAITPTRDDGLNDCFYLPDEYKPLISDFKIEIFNRWGTVVYRATDKNFRWDGRINGKIYFNVVYRYLIFCEDIIGRPYILKGTITVL